MTEFRIPKVENATLDYVPARIAWRYCVLPESVSDGTISLFCPDEPAFEMEQALIVRFVLNWDLVWIPIPRKLIEIAIATYYPEPETTIQNCDVRFRFRCPKTWDSLALTKNLDQRLCSVCERIVYRCFDKSDAVKMGKEGKCVAYLDDSSCEFLGEIDVDG